MTKVIVIGVQKINICYGWELCNVKKKQLFKLNKLWIDNTPTIVYVNELNKMGQNKRIG